MKIYLQFDFIQQVLLAFMFDLHTCDLQSLRLYCNLLTQEEINKLIYNININVNKMQ